MTTSTVTYTNEVEFGKAPGLAGARWVVHVSERRFISDDAELLATHAQAEHAAGRTRPLADVMSDLRAQRG
jgi:hypothetical protein